MNEKWIRELRESQERLDEFLAGVDETAFSRKPGAGWSVAENLEHLILVETRVLQGLRLVCSRPGAPPADPLADDEVWRRSLGGSGRAEAPASVTPAGQRGELAAMRGEMARRREETLAYAASTSDPLAERTMRMPAGELTGEQCFGMLAAHMERHLRQMRVALGGGGAA